ncbi:methionine aminopeptidase 2b [Phtheirospermum japonicum]|uniref:Methionine aminopeptidase 2b n=1 Tax=Phtheirospermum japonicum TaxID=374723 RepID=A0A830BYA3_9LAMI|nr:methionine aminopeptidase 2b [Phtheirospermum japonicum]
MVELQDCTEEVEDKVGELALGEPQAAKKKKSKHRKKKGPPQQIDQPSVPLVELLASGEFPEGDIQLYKDEYFTKDVIMGEGPMYAWRARKYMWTIIKAGMLMDLCETLEDTVHKLISENGLKDGIAFPTGCSLNRVAAHWTPSTGDATVLQYNDVMKLHFGTHVDGLMVIQLLSCCHIVDSVFTVALNPMFKPLLEASCEATNTGIKEAEIDVRVCDMGAVIQEVLESYEVEINGNMSQEGSGCSHYMKFDASHIPLRLPREKQHLANISKNFSTLPFYRRYLDRIGKPC